MEPSVQTAVLVSRPTLTPDDNTRQPVLQLVGFGLKLAPVIEWAAHPEVEVPIELGGLSKVNYSYTLDHGGPYQVHVGCGGTPENWATDLRSDYVTGSRDFLCNDMNALEGAAWNIIKGRVFGSFGPSAKKLTQNVPYGKCNAT